MSFQCQPLPTNPLIDINDPMVYRKIIKDEKNNMLIWVWVLVDNKNQCYFRQMPPHMQRVICPPLGSTYFVTQSANPYTEINRYYTALIKKEQEREKIKSSINYEATLHPRNLPVLPGIKSVSPTVKPISSEVEKQYLNMAASASAASAAPAPASTTSSSKNKSSKPVKISSLTVKNEHVNYYPVMSKTPTLSVSPPITNSLRNSAPEISNSYLYGLNPHAPEFEPSRHLKNS